MTLDIGQLVGAVSVPRLLILAALALLFMTAACATKKEPVPAPPEPKPEPHPKAECPFVYVEGSEFYYQGKPYPLKGVNYFPAANSWRNMWLRWKPEAIEKEIALLETLGINTVRLFVDRKTFTKSSRSIPDEMLARVRIVLDALERHGMKAIVTLFMWDEYDPAKLWQCKEHARKWAGEFYDDDRILAWDISNELDHRWAKGKRSFPQMRKFALEVADSIRVHDRNHLIMSGEFGHFLGDRSDWRGSGIAPDLSKMTLPVEQADVVCFHWYGHNKGLDVALEKLRKITNKPILVQEIGLPTAGLHKGKPWGLSEQDVAAFTNAWMNVAKRHGAYLAYWCGFDYEAEGTGHLSENDTELYFGLFDVGYRLKANGAAFSGKTVPTAADGALPPIKHYEKEEK